MRSLIADLFAEAEQLRNESRLSGSEIDGFDPVFVFPDQAHPLPDVVMKVGLLTRFPAVTEAAAHIAEVADAPSYFPFFHAVIPFPDLKKWLLLKNLL